MRVLYPNGLPMQGLSAGAAEGDTADSRMPHQTGSSIYAPVRCQSLGQGTGRRERLICQMGGDDGESDVLFQHGIKDSKQTLERPLALLIEGSYQLCPSEILTHDAEVGGSMDVV